MVNVGLRAEHELRSAAALDCWYMLYEGTEKPSAESSLQQELHENTFESMVTVPCVQAVSARECSYCISILTCRHTCQGGERLQRVRLSELHAAAQVDGLELAQRRQRVQALRCDALPFAPAT